MSDIRAGVELVCLDGDGDGAEPPGVRLRRSLVFSVARVTEEAPG